MSCLRSTCPEASLPPNARLPWPGWSAQSYPVHEVIVVDDGSIDGTADVVAGFRDQVTYVHQANSGVSAARNRGIDLAQGDLIAFLDSDDLWDPTKIERQVACFAVRPELSMCFTYIQNFWMPDMAEEAQKQRDQDLARMAIPFIPSSTVIRKTAFELAGNFDTAMVIGEDGDLYQRMDQLGLEHEVVPDLLVRRRLHGKNATRGLCLESRYEKLRMAMNMKTQHATVQKKAVPEPPVPDPDPPAEQEQFFNRVYAAFECAERKSGFPQKRYYFVAGHGLSLRFAGRELAPRMIPSLSHIAVPSCLGPFTTLCLWDSASTGVPMPDFPHGPDDVTWRGEMVSMQKGPIRGSYSRAADMMSLFNTRDGRAIFWVRDAATVPYYETGSPMKNLLHWTLGQQGIQFIHGAAVGIADGCVLLAGPGGSGKSTTALSCLEAGMDYVSDDYCLVKAEPEPTAISIYSSGKINSADVDRFPFLGSIIKNTSRLEKEKALFLLLDRYREKIVNRRPLRAVIIPRVVDQAETRLIPTSSMEALNALMVSTVFQLPWAGQQDLDRMRPIIKQLPAYTLELGSDKTAAPKVLRELLEKG